MEILQSIQYTKNAMEKKEEQRSTIRKRNILVLIQKYLQDQGFRTSAKALIEEVSVKLEDYSVCDNIDLDLILQEYETFQYVKFRQYPHVVKKIALETKGTSINSNMKKPVGKTRPFINKCATGKIYDSPSRDSSPVSGRYPPRPLSHCSTDSNDNYSPNKPKLIEKSLSRSISNASTDLSVEGTTFGKYPGFQNHSEKIVTPSPPRSNNNNRGAPQQSQFQVFQNLNPEWKNLVDIISKDIFLENPKVSWDSIIGCENAKRLIKEAVVYPIKHPHLFSGLLAPWKGLLIYGPPGNGKTLLAKAVATECQTTFFNISASTIVSKWRGDSEKLVRVLFEMARYHAPSTIFLDELDALMCKRDTMGSSEHEASRRMKTELLVQMDGLNNGDELVFVLAATNVPWDLDHAILRRLEKRILVPLPDESARLSMLQYFLPKSQNDEKSGGLAVPVGHLDYKQLAQVTEGYSGADIKLVCKEAAMQSLRSVFSLLDEGVTDKDQLCDALSPIETNNVANSIRRTKPSTHGLEEKFLKWQLDFGSI